jgi:chromosome segregation ATPase
LSTAKSSFIRREVDFWGSLQSLRTLLARATACLSQQGAEVADLRLLCADLGAEAAAARAEVQRRRSEFDQVADERDQFRGRAAEAESRAGALAADLAVAQAASSELRARAGGMSWLFSVFVSACFLHLCLRPCALAVRRARVCP